MLLLRVLITGILFLSLLGCLPSIPPETPEPRKPFLYREEGISVPLTDDGERNSLELAVERSLSYLEKKKTPGTFPAPSSRRLSPEGIHHSLALFREILQTTPDGAEIEEKLRKNFNLYNVSYQNSNNSILLTGYYEPVLEGSLEPGADFPYPLYRRPDDLMELTPDEGAPGGSRSRQVVRMEGGQAVPYYSRREIDTEGVLRGKGMEIIWLKDRWQRFVLHVQGSGQVRLPDGRTIRVGYAASNGRLYKSIGRYLIDSGFLSEKDVSMPRIKEWVERTPGWAEEAYNVNERYIFFRILPEPEGPLGALGFPLTPGRSIATDLTIFPPGALAYLVSREPILDEEGRVAGWKPLHRLVLNQDTGAAMKGPGRVDLFFGSGEKAGTAAGEMREEGKIYLLLAK